MSGYKGSTRSLKLFPGLAFELLDEPPPSKKKCRHKGCKCTPGRACDVCGMSVEGSVFHCKEKGLDVHPTCAMLDETVCVDHVSFKLRKGEAKSKCIWCNQKKPRGSEDKIQGFRYESGCGDYTFHVFCLMDMESKHRSSSSPSPLTGQCCSCHGNRQVSAAVSDARLKIRGGRGGGSSKFVKVVKMFLTIVLSVLFGDPTAIIASVVVQLLT